MLREIVSSNRGEDALTDPTVSSDAVPEELVVVSGGSGLGLGRDSLYDHAMATVRLMHPTRKIDKQMIFEACGRSDVVICDLGNRGSVSRELLILLLSLFSSLDEVSLFGLVFGLYEFVRLLRALSAMNV